MGFEAAAQPAPASSLLALSEPETQLLQLSLLPDLALLRILSLCDIPEICALSRSSRLLARLGSSRALWPNNDVGPVVNALRNVLSNVLRLPPQVRSIVRHQPLPSCM